MNIEPKNKQDIYKRTKCFKNFKTLGFFKYIFIFHSLKEVLNIISLFPNVWKLEYIKSSHDDLYILTIQNYLSFMIVHRL